ncbi:hypothetical protein SERLADRAFT_468018 [Serpula lacrymans var. lacrymans S7.9]|nr:uncharacterized protein SERLADRAFT_468018 [Serpula lacrymans var. lacrymans S7.9]EGO24541.1 hypothetical protein SERLADRAFT_468018 [Serpula lacrymans var. lacrymans S7.9]
MQQHILFWDRDADGEIWPLDTYRGFRDLGFNMLFSFLTIFIVNLSFTLPTSLERSFFPDPFFRVFIPHIHKGKHGSDTGIYDNEGRFVPSRFEDLFARYAKRSKENPDVLANSLSLLEVFELMKGQRCAVDPFGWSAAMFEWVTAWLLLQQGGRVDKEDLRRLYDGSIFFEISEARQSKEGWNKGWGMGGDGFIGGERVLPFGL